MNALLYSEVTFVQVIFHSSATSDKCTLFTECAVSSQDVLLHLVNLALSLSCSCPRLVVSMYLLPCGVFILTGTHSAKDSLADLGFELSLTHSLTHSLSLSLLSFYLFLSRSLSLSLFLSFHTQYVSIYTVYIYMYLYAVWVYRCIYIHVHMCT